MQREEEEEEEEEEEKEDGETVAAFTSHFNFPLPSSSSDLEKAEV